MIINIQQLGYEQNIEEIIGKKKKNCKKKWEKSKIGDYNQVRFR